MTSVVVLGHRGGRGEGWPAENTLAAFARAREEGADGVELDVRLTADGVPVVFHDTTLARATGAVDTRALHRVAFAELPVLAGGERIPHLVEALDAMRGQIVNIEIKSDVAPTSLLGDVPARLRLVRATAAAVKKAERVEIICSSFDPLVVVALAALLPRTPRAILVDKSTPRAATTLPLALRPAVVAAHLHDTLVTAARVERLRRSHLRVAAWTVNDPERAAALVASGVAWIITDAPGAVVQRLSSGCPSGAPSASPDVNRRN